MNSTNQERIRLLLLGDQALFRTSLARYLTAEPGFEVVCECASDDEALAALAAGPVEVVLLDFDRGVHVHAGFIPAARRAGYEGRFLVLVAADDAPGSAAAIKLGASGIFLKSEAADRLAQAIRLVADGAVWLDRKLIEGLADQLTYRLSGWDPANSQSALNDREHKVLLGVMSGLTNQKIAGRIGISEGSVKASLQRLFSRAGVRTRSQLVRIALEGWLGNVKGSAGRGAIDADRAPARHGDD